MRRSTSKWMPTLHGPQSSRSASLLRTNSPFSSFGALSPPHKHGRRKPSHSHTSTLYRRALSLFLPANPTLSLPLRILSAHLASQGREKPALLPVLLIPLPQDNFKARCIDSAISLSNFQLPLSAWTCPSSSDHALESHLKISIFIGPTPTSTPHLSIYFLPNQAAPKACTQMPLPLMLAHCTVSATAHPPSTRPTQH